MRSSRGYSAIGSKMNADAIELFFPTSIYSEGMVRRAAYDYQDICDCEISVLPDGINCRFHDSVTELELTVLEFSNYLVELSNARGLI